MVVTCLEHGLGGPLVILGDGYGGVQEERKLLNGVFVLFNLFFSLFLVDFKVES